MKNREDAEGRRGWLAWVALVGLTVLAYLPAMRGGFLWDDDAHVTRPELRALHGLWRIWFEPGATQQYYPVLHSAFWLEHRLWGDATVGYHLFNVLLHALAACLFVCALRRLGVVWAWLGGLLFALHPVCVESVAWISEQKNTLSTVFYLISALLYLRFEGGRAGEARFGAGGALGSEAPQGRDARPYLLATVFFMLAILSKSVTASLPAALLVVIGWKRGRLEWRRDLVPLLPWFAIGVAGGLFTAWVERRYVGASGAAFDLGVGQRVELAGSVIWFYLGKLIWPANLIFIYPHWDVKGWGGLQAACPLGVAAVLVGCWLMRKRTRSPLAALLVFVGTLFPALGFFNVYPFTFSYVADHFQYLASLGVFAFAAGGLEWISRRVPGRVVPVLAAGLCCALGVLSWRQSRIYRSAEQLYAATIERNPGCWMAQNNLGLILAKEGRLPEAVARYQAALQLKPADAEILDDLGVACLQEGRLDEAIASLEEAVRSAPSFARAQNNLGDALLRAGRIREAIEHDEAGVRLAPDFADTQENLANALLAAGRYGEAAAHYQAALRINADIPQAHNNLGIALWRLGRIPEAEGHFQAALRLRPGYAEAQNNLEAVRKALEAEDNGR